jgi:hypothetical protein
MVDVNLLNFSAVKINKDASLKWQVNNNKDAASYEVEYSFDNRSFTKLSSILPNNALDIADYSYSYLFSETNAAVVYYRIKVVGKDGKIKYSNVAVLRTALGSNTNVSIFPNPTHGELWMSLNSSVKEIADLYVWDPNGKLISITKIAIAKGENTLMLPRLSGKPKGNYLVKIKSANNDITQKVVLF